MGLVTDDIIRRLIKFAQTILGREDVEEAENESKKQVSKESVPPHKNVSKSDETQTQSADESK